ncbi:putative casparian strip membrane protein [Dioscorea sansibarensis]
MEGVKPERRPNYEANKNYLRTITVLRILAFISTLSATFVMVFNKQTVQVLGLEMSASFKSSPAFVFFVIGNVIVCAYSLVSLGFLSTLLNGYLLHLLDLVVMVLAMAAVSSATAIGYLGKKGNAHTGWSQVCSMFGKFCKRVQISLACSFAAAIVLLAICMLSSVHKTKQINTY